MRWPWNTTAEGASATDTSSENEIPLQDSLLTWPDPSNPSTLIPTLVLTSSIFLVAKLYRSYLRRIPQAVDIPPSFLRRRSLLGQVTYVGDGDDFRIYHTPGGWLAGWGWLPGRKIPTKRSDLTNQTIHVRIAGIDAPEGPHFGRPAQPYADDALAWLRAYVGGRRVRAYVHRRDHYERVVASVVVWRGLLRRDVGLQMLRAGMATVYEAKSGVEFGKLEEKYRRAEWWAKTRRKGIWWTRRADFESPREFKNKKTEVAAKGS
ncbi:MAG: putative endonuclease lcl3 [Trizodia sp. TS-e1964]|nr:MAG: putative endonuclease lcl3 [Trizodia sp. TS-e1964]